MHRLQTDGGCRMARQLGDSGGNVAKNLDQAFDSNAVGQCRTINVPTIKIAAVPNLRPRSTQRHRKLTRVPLNNRPQRLSQMNMLLRIDMSGITTDHATERS